MTAPRRTVPQLVAGDQIAPALTNALAGGPPLAPLPQDPTERQRAVQMLQPEQAVPEPDVAAIVATSGSTGAPKGVLLSRSAIRASVQATHERLGGPGDWALALPPHYVAGLMVLARTLVAGTAAHPVAPGLADLGAVRSRMRGRRYISVVPTQLVRALDHPATAEALAGFDAVLLGGAAIDLTLRERARAAGIRVVTSYGMSETCGGCVYDGRPLDGAEVTLEAGTHRILLAGSMLFSGYRLRPDATAEALTVTVGADDLSRPTLRTADRGRLGDHLLTVLGRVDDVVITGGLNVDLAEVERVCGGWPAPGGDLAVVGVPDAEWGTRVVAVTDQAGSLAELRAFLAGSLPGYAAPRQLVWVESLPRTASGKIDRQRLVTIAADG